MRHCASRSTILGRYPNDELPRDTKGENGWTETGLYDFTGGNLFELTNNNGNWVETVVHDFAGGRDGTLPYARPVVTGTGMIYGTTVNGGRQGKGTVYQINP